MLLMLRYHALVTRTQYDSEKEDLEKNIDDLNKKIPNTSGLVKRADYNTKITEIEYKVPSITRSFTTPPLNTKTTENDTLFDT